MRPQSIRSSTEARSRSLRWQSFLQHTIGVYNYRTGGKLEEGQLPLLSTSGQKKGPFTMNVL